MMEETDYNYISKSQETSGVKAQYCTYPATLVGNPLRYSLRHNKLDDPADDVGEEATNATAQVGYCQPVAET